MATAANAKKAANKKRPHLSDLFRVGEVVTVKDDEGNEYQIFVRRPSPLQLEKARETANGRMGRHKREAFDPVSDIRIGMEAGVQDSTREELLEIRVQFDAPEFRDEAFNEVLYSDDEDGENWNEDDRYLTVLAGISERMADIKKYNDEMKEADAVDFIDEEEDAQLVSLMVDYDLFQSQVEERADVLIAEKSESRGNMTIEELREDVIKTTVELEARMIWYEAYQVTMLYYACRYPDDKKKLYFSEPDEVLEIPQYIRGQLYDAYEKLEAGSEDVKNSLSLLNSSAI
jgi:hypothetical protein